MDLFDKPSLSTLTLDYMSLAALLTMDENFRIENFNSISSLLFEASFQCLIAENSEDEEKIKATSILRMLKAPNSEQLDIVIAIIGSNCSSPNNARLRLISKASLLFIGD